MRKIVLLAAMLIVPGLMAGPAAAGDRGPGFRHSPPHIGAKPHFSHHGKWFHGRHFGPPRHFRPPHVGRPGGVVVFKFHQGGFGFKRGTFAPVRPPHFRPPHFRPPHYRPPVLTFGHAPHFKSWAAGRDHHRAWRGRPHHRR